MSVKQRKLHNIAHLEITLTIGHIENTVVGTAAHHGDALITGDEVVHVTHIGATHGQQCPLADTNIHIGGLATECVDTQLTLGMAGLFPNLDDLGLQSESVGAHIVHVRNAPAGGEIHQEQLAHPQVVDALGHGAVMHQREAGSRTARDYLQGAADLGFNALGNGDQVVHLLHGGTHRTVAAQIYTDTQQMQVGHGALYRHAGGHHLVLIPKAFPQIAQVCHDDDAVALVLLGALLFQRLDGGKIALEGDLAQGHHIGQLRHGGDADEPIRPFNSCVAAALHLLKAAGAKGRGAVLPHDAGNGRQGVTALDDAADIDAHFAAAGHGGLYILLKTLFMYD